NGMTALLQVKNLSVHFGTFLAITGVNLEIFPGQSVGIVGASGSGKTALVHAIAKISKGTVSGKILFNGQENVTLGIDIGMIFQDPMTYLNPTLKVGKQIVEGLLYHGKIRKHEAKNKAIELL